MDGKDGGQRTVGRLDGWMVGGRALYPSETSGTGLDAGGKGPVDRRQRPVDGGPKEPASL